MSRPKRLDPIMVLTMKAEKMMPRKGPTSCPPAWPRTRRQGQGSGKVRQRQERATPGPSTTMAYHSAVQCNIGMSHRGIITPPLR